MTSHVYFIRPRGQASPVKIGWSAVPKNRLENLMIWSPLPLEIVATTPGDWKLERRIHGIFAASHSHHEWFHASRPLNELMDRLSVGVPLADIIDLAAPLSPFRTRKKREFTADRRLYLSYACRLRWAYKRLWLPNAEGLYSPTDVDAILFKWGGWGGAPITPTAEQIARIEDVIRNPVPHGIRSSEKYRKAA